MSLFTASQSDLLHSYTDSGYLVRPPHYLEDHLAFYGSYHTRLTTKIIHAICTPVLMVCGVAMALELFSNYVYLVYLGYLCLFPLPYLYIDTFSGLSWLPVGILVLFVAYFLQRFVNVARILLTGIIFFGAQFGCHYYIEYRPPARSESFIRAVIIGPLWLWFEFVLFPAGYYDHIKENIQHKIEQRHKERRQRWEERKERMDKEREEWKKQQQQKQPKQQNQPKKRRQKRKK